MVAMTKQDQVQCFGHILHHWPSVRTKLERIINSSPSQLILLLILSRPALLKCFLNTNFKL